MLVAVVEEADVGRCEAAAACASVRAASVRPAIRGSGSAVVQFTSVEAGLVWSDGNIHFLCGACFSTLRASSGTSAQLPFDNAASNKPTYRAPFSAFGAFFTKLLMMADQRRCRDDGQC